MTLEELYREIGGDYQNILGRLQQEERIEKFVRLFLKDTSYQTFLKALEAKNAEDAFRAVHTLKGISMNLSFDELCRVSSRFTEYLRAKDISRAAEVLPELAACYEKHYQAICAYAESQKEQKG